MVKSLLPASVWVDIDILELSLLLKLDYSFTGIQQNKINPKILENPAIKSKAIVKQPPQCSVYLMTA